MCTGVDTEAMGTLTTGALLGKTPPSLPTSTIGELMPYVREICGQKEVRRTAPGFVGYGRTKEGARVLIAVDTPYDRRVVRAMAVVGVLGHESVSLAAPSFGRILRGGPRDAAGGVPPAHRAPFEEPSRGGARAGQPALACLLFSGSAASVLLVSDLFEFSWRYQLPAVVTLAPAGALGIGVLVNSVRTRSR